MYGKITSCSKITEIWYFYRSIIVKLPAFAKFPKFSRNFTDFCKITDYLYFLFAEYVCNFRLCLIFEHILFNVELWRVKNQTVNQIRCKWKENDTNLLKNVYLLNEQ